VIVLEKLDSCPYQTVERVCDMCIHFDTIPECDGQTVGFAITISRSACIGMVMCNKKYLIWLEHMECDRSIETTS